MYQSTKKYQRTWSRVVVFHADQVSHCSHPGESQRDIKVRANVTWNETALQPASAFCVSTTSKSMGIEGISSPSSFKASWTSEYCMH
jgi:hypothetical protein